MGINATQMLNQYKKTADEYKENVIDKFYSMAVWEFIDWNEYVKFINAVVKMQSH